MGKSIYLKFLRALDSKRAFIFLAVLFRLILELGYWAYVNPVHSYAGFSWEPNIVKYFESWCLFACLIVFLPYMFKKPSDFLMNILFFGLMAPLLAFYALADQIRSFLYIVILGYLIIAFIQKGRPLAKFNILQKGRVFAFVIICVGALGVTAWFIASGSFANFNLDLTQVYKYRRITGELIHIGPMGYINTWAWKVFGPTLLAIGLWQKKYWLVYLAIGLHVLWFGVSAHKSVLFYPVLIFFLWYWFRRSNSISFYPACLAAVVLLSLACFFLFNYNLPGSLFIRRVFFGPANNTFDYYEFFSKYPFVWWSNSSVSLGLIDSPYTVKPAELIGLWRGRESHVNNTFLSTGYMHAGILGIVIYGVLVGLLFRLIDSLATGDIPAWLAAAIIVVPSWSLLLSADLPASILTHGIGIGVVLLFLMRRTVRNQGGKNDL